MRDWALDPTLITFMGRMPGMIAMGLGVFRGYKLDDQFCFLVSCFGSTPEGGCQFERVAVVGIRIRRIGQYFGSRQVGRRVFGSTTGGDKATGV